MSKEKTVFHTTDADFKELIKTGLVVVDFYADWCMPCQMMVPEFEAASKELTKVKFVKLNTDQNQQTSSKYLISGIPTFILFKDGKEIGRFSGYRKKEDLIADLKEIIIARQ